MPSSNALRERTHLVRIEIPMVTWPRLYNSGWVVARVWWDTAHGGWRWRLTARSPEYARWTGLNTVAEDSAGRLLSRGTDRGTPSWYMIAAIRIFMDKMVEQQRATETHNYDRLDEEFDDIFDML